MNKKNTRPSHEPTQKSTPSLRVAIAQTNMTVGDIRGNTDIIIDYAQRARDTLEADVVLFPELALTGYPPEDLLLRPDLYQRIEPALQEIIQATRGIDAIIGYPYWAEDNNAIYNACACIQNGVLAERYFKQELPNYGVFDEKRYFSPGMGVVSAPIKGVKVAFTICEDIWSPGPMRLAADVAKAKLMFNINASPYHAEKIHAREALLAKRAREGNMPIVYVNLVGGQDELVFDGHSLVVDAKGKTVFRAPDFEAGLFLVTFDTAPTVRPQRQRLLPLPPPEESIYRALVTGVRDYVEKNRFRGAVVGLSGGIDSALTLTIAVDALGPERVEAVLMPSRYTADMSIEDASMQAKTLGVAHHIIPIEPVFSTFLDSLGEVFAGTEPDVTEENIQARCRGVLLMAISNKTGKVVLTTGNKSEMAVGYATLYGDMAGGFAPLKDVAKEQVYQLARWRNKKWRAEQGNGEMGSDSRDLIPQRVLTRPPTAELAPDQKDEDSLPPYPILDAILERYVEYDHSPEEIIADGFDPETVARVSRMVLRNEYKRRQAAPGVRITQRAFGRDRRYPITSGYGG
uniref:Glutamine-dependent NAD(+) synthetase n=1 Tax=Candidatus Kentrum sp. UNK TaxID=2126344 RepID=A0A451AUY2_9GAMM|nr:MAG: NAD+ synthase (glutamine-hydrolysing) [Candidatus Kentron sp. UNK]VFK69832.1 MAG: NAD+ synthase (glutamine-hydrolysing) [Candidatus Kentron sp. UNK]